MIIDDHSDYDDGDDDDNDSITMIMMMVMLMNDWRGGGRGDGIDSTIPTSIIRTVL